MHTLKKVCKHFLENQFQNQTRYQGVENNRLKNKTFLLDVNEFSINNKICTSWLSRANSHWRLKFLTLIVPKYSATLFMQGGGVTYDPPPLSPVLAVIKGQTKKQMIKFCKKTNFKQFFNGCYRYLTVKPLKTVIHINASGRCIFYSINLKFYEKARFCICHKIQFFLFTATRR